MKRFSFKVFFLFVLCINTYSNAQTDLRGGQINLDYGPSKDENENYYKNGVVGNVFREETFYNSSITFPETRTFSNVVFNNEYYCRNIAFKSSANFDNISFRNGADFISDTFIQIQ